MFPNNFLADLLVIFAGYGIFFCYLLCGFVLTSIARIIYFRYFGISRSELTDDLPTVVVLAGIILLWPLGIIAVIIILVGLLSSRLTRVFLSKE